MRTSPGASKDSSKQETVDSIQGKILSLSTILLFYCLPLILRKWKALAMIRVEVTFPRVRRVPCGDLKARRSLARKAKELAKAILQEEKVRSAEISIAFVDNAQIRALAKRYLGRDEETDVLSFPSGSRKRGQSPFFDSRGKKGTVPFSAKESLAGEVVVSAEMAEEEAARYGNEPEAESLLYVAHGLLHLLGYDDKRPPVRSIMRRKEREILVKSGVKITS